MRSFGVGQKVHLGFKIRVHKILWKNSNILSGQINSYDFAFLTKLFVDHQKSKSASASEVAQSYPAVCNPMDCSLPGSSIHGIFQARVLEWVAISFSRGSSRPRDWTQVSRIAGRCFTVWATRKALKKAKEFHKSIYFWFIGYATAFDCVDHKKKLWKILKEMGIPNYLTCLLRNLYSGQEATVRTGHGTTDLFQTGKGVCQACVLSLCLFNLYAEYIMRNIGLEEA